MSLNTRSNLFLNTPGDHPHLWDHPPPPPWATLSNPRLLFLRRNFTLFPTWTYPSLEERITKILFFHTVREDGNYLPCKETILPLISAQLLDFSNGRSPTNLQLNMRTVFQTASFPATPMCVLSNGNKTYFHLWRASLHLSSFSLGQFHCHKNQPAC